MGEDVNVKHFTPCIDKPLIFLEWTLGCSGYSMFLSLIWALQWLTRSSTWSVCPAHVNNLPGVGCVCEESPAMPRWRWGGLVWSPGDVLPVRSVHTADICDINADINALTRAFSAAALYIEMEGVSRGKELGEHGYFWVSPWSLHYRRMPESVHKITPAGNQKWEVYNSQETEKGSIPGSEVESRESNICVLSHFSEWDFRKQPS